MGRSGLGIRFARRTLFMYAAVGLIATSVHFSVLLVLVELLTVEEVLASAAAFAVAALTSYQLNRIWSFRSRRRHRTALPRYIVVALSGLLLNVVIMRIGLYVLNVWYVAAQTAVFIVVPLTTFVLNSVWTFGHGRQVSEHGHNPEKL